MTLQYFTSGRAPRRRDVLSAGAGLAAMTAMGAAAFAPLPARALSRLDSRGRYRLSVDFAPVLGEDRIPVPLDVVEFQSGSDLSLQPDGRVLINTSGLYEVTFCADWDLKAGRDIGLRQTGVKQQRSGQPDFPLSAHARVIFGDMPGSNPSQHARTQVPWSPPSVALGAVVTTDVIVEPADLARPGDLALASHTQIKDGALPPDALAALVVQAKVIAPDTVRVSLYNPSVAAGIVVPPGTLNVMVMSAKQIAGGSGDGWHPLHSPSIELQAGDKIYGTVRHHVAGSLVQATKMSFLQIDRLE